MKPQCTTSAECLRELARVMEQFGIGDPQEAISSKYVGKGRNNYDTEFLPHFFHPLKWSFAIAEVEDKPVFPGDELWCYGDKYVVISKHPTCDGLQWSNGDQLLGIPLKHWSWNPPKPKTVMVELLVEDAQEWTKFVGYNDFHDASKRLYEACKKALENLK